MKLKWCQKESANSTRPVPSQSGLALEITRPTLPTNRHTDREEWNNVLDSVPITVTISDPVVHCAHGIVLLSLHRLDPISKKACVDDDERNSKPLAAYTLKGDTEHTAGNMKSVSPLLTSGLAWKSLVASIHDTTWNKGLVTNMNWLPQKFCTETSLRRFFVWATFWVEQVTTMIEQSRNN